MPWFLPGSDASSARQDSILVRSVTFGLTGDGQLASQRNGDKQHRTVPDRSGTPEALRVSQQYQQLLNKPLPPPPVGGGPGCQDSCCWRWLTAMLLQEMQVLRKALAESREAFVEQERIFAGLDDPPDEWAYAELLNQYQETRAEHETLTLQAPELREKVDELHLEIQQRHRECLFAEVKVRKLSEQQDVEDAKIKELEERLFCLQNNVRENEEQQRNAQESEEEAQKAVRNKLELIQMVADDHHQLLLRRDLMQVGERFKKRRGKSPGEQGMSARKLSTRPLSASPDGAAHGMPTADPRSSSARRGTGTVRAVSETGRQEEGKRSGDGPAELPAQPMPPQSKAAGLALPLPGRSAERRGSPPMRKSTQKLGSAGTGSLKNRGAAP